MQSCFEMKILSFMKKAVVDALKCVDDEDNDETEDNDD